MGQKKHKCDLSYIKGCYTNILNKVLSPKSAPCRQIVLLIKHRINVPHVKLLDEQMGNNFQVKTSGKMFYIMET